MSYENTLNAEIDKELDRLAEANFPWRANMIAHAICSNHSDGLIEGEDKEFWRHCGYEKVRSAVTRRINRRAGEREDESDNQHRLPGYEHVHAYYVVRRDGDDIGVAAHALTDDEIDAKSARYKEMGRTCFSHADELQRFKRERQAGEAA